MQIDMRSQGPRTISLDDEIDCILTLAHQIGDHNVQNHNIGDRRPDVLKSAAQRLVWLAHAMRDPVSGAASPIGPRLEARMAAGPSPEKKT